MNISPLGIAEFFGKMNPTINAAINLAEMIFPAGTGPSQKYPFVEGIIKAAARAIPHLEADVEDVVSAAKPVIEAGVKLIKDVEAVFAGQSGGANAPA